MNIFYISNFSSIIVAEQIINQLKLSNNYALINYLNDNYSHQIISNLNRYKFEYVGIAYNYSGNNIHSKKIINLINRIKNNFYNNSLKFYNNKFDDNRIDLVFLSNLNSKDQIDFYSYCKIKNVEVRLFDEGISNGYIDSIFKIKNTNFIKLQIKSILKFLIKRISTIANESVSLTFKHITESGDIKHYYSFFPQLFIDHKITSYCLDFNQYISSINQFITPKYIFFSRPLSEDNIISYNDEIEIIRTIRLHIPRDSYIKFHPRESGLKIDEIVNTLGFKTLPEDIEMIPGELLLKSIYLTSIYGYLTTTMFFAATFTNIKVVSFIELLGDSVINPNELIKIKNDFPNIKFLSNKN
jgi:hypothetical protein